MSSIMFRCLLIVLVSMVLSSHSAEDNVFKNCAAVDFCQRLRNTSPTTTYKVDAKSLRAYSNDGYVELTLLPSRGYSNIIVKISVLEGGSARIQLLETTTSRHLLEDVLVAEPSLEKITVGYNRNQLLIQSDTSQTHIEVNYSPFSVAFSWNGVEQVVLDANRLIVESTTASKAFAFSVSFPQAIQLYGIPDHSENLALKTTTATSDPYRLRNLDVSNHEINSPKALYGSVPVLYGHGSQSTSGIFLHNAAQQWFDVSNGVRNTKANVIVESGSFDLFILPGPNPNQVVRQYVSLTGKAHLPQLWTLGYHQSRWSYPNQEDVKEVVAKFNEKNIPLDAIWLDIDYTDGERSFTWNPETFSDPIELQQTLSSSNKKLVAIINPQIKVDKEYHVYAGALERDLYVKNKGGSNFEGLAGPGLSSYIDFLNPEARNYYASLHSYENFANTTPVLAGIWNDNNAPSVLDDALERTLPGDAVHQNGVQHKDIHGIYGLLQTRATHQGLIERDNGEKRPFVLTKAYFAGSQRYAATYIPDTRADWAFLALSYAQCLNSNLLGIVFCGADIGGFEGNPDTELLQRWYQAGAWLPFYRAHSSSATDRREPFLFDSNVQNVVTKALQSRYKHIPVWYTLFFEHSINGDPVIRPLFYQYPEDTDVVGIDDQLLVGENILVRPVTKAGVTDVSIYFPGGPNEYWVNQETLDIRPGNGYANVPVTLDSIPLYYKAGSIIVQKVNNVLSTEEFVDDIRYNFIVINTQTDKTASTTLYVDDYTSFRYRDQSEYLYLNVVYSNGELHISQLHNSNSCKFSIRINSVSVITVYNNANDERLMADNKHYISDVSGNLLEAQELKVHTNLRIKLA